MGEAFARLALQDALKRLNLKVRVFSSAILMTVPVVDTFVTSSRPLSTAPSVASLVSFNALLAPESRAGCRARRSCLLMKMRRRPTQSSPRCVVLHYLSMSLSLWSILYQYEDTPPSSLPEAKDPDASSEAEVRVTVLRNFLQCLTTGVYKRSSARRRQKARRCVLYP